MFKATKRKWLSLFGWQLLFLAALGVVLTIFIVLVPKRKFFEAAFVSERTSEGPSLDVLTLAVNRPEDKAYVEHNCLRISRTRHSFTIFTDDLLAPVCNICQCIKFKPTNCKCAKPYKPPTMRCFMCEKMAFYTEELRKRKEIVILDSDLVILRDDFLDKLAIRSISYDFLAAYVPLDRNMTDYYATFNSGLFFMRWVPGLDYEEMKKIMYDANLRSDQKVLTLFVQEKYKSWDTLSYRWHCRQLKRGDFNIPLDECYTHHDDRERRGVLDALNFTLETVTGI